MPVTMNNLDALRDELPEVARDLRLNLQSVLQADKLTPEQTWGVALASAYFVRDAELIDAVLGDAKEAGIDDAVIEDARAAAALMGMNTMYYRFRHLVSNSNYNQVAPRLRMQRMGQPATDATTFELFAMAAAVLSGCQMCINAHESKLRKGEMTEEEIHEAVRIAAVVHGVAVAKRI
ncbi:MAG: carboxymuconolactone decarboxylase family protein [Phycisphaeraceae bacterium]